jgi:hypothetical protein
MITFLGSQQKRNIISGYSLPLKIQKCSPKRPQKPKKSPQKTRKICLKGPKTQK